MKSLYILCFQLILVSCLPTNEEKARQEQRILDSITDVKERDALHAKHFNDSVKLLQLRLKVKQDSIFRANQHSDSLAKISKSKKKPSPSKRKKIK